MATERVSGRPVPRRLPRLNRGFGVVWNAAAGIDHRAAPALGERGAGRYRLRRGEQSSIAPIAWAAHRIAPLLPRGSVIAEGCPAGILLGEGVAGRRTGAFRNWYRNEAVDTGQRGASDTMSR